MRYLSVIISILTLSACDHIGEDSKAVGNEVKSDSKQVASNVGDSIAAVATQVRDNVKVTAEKLHKWAIEPPPGKKPPQPIKASYCYHVYQDILCYRQPMPGWEYRTAGYQPQNAAPPPAAVMQPLPLHKADANQLPATRVAEAKPVFASPPPVVKEPEKEVDPAAAADPSHEQLPDPALAPQL